MPPVAPLSTLLSRVLIAFTIEFDNEFERRLAETGLRARVVSLVMWSNFLRFVGDAITVSELPDAAGLPKSRVLSTLGGMERWGYVFVGPQAGAKRDGYGSARGLRSDWVVRPTPAGRAAEEIWPPLLGEIERRWEERFGGDAVEELRGSLRAFVDRLDVELPEYLPIVGSADGMVAGVSARERRETPSGLHLTALLSQVLLAYAIDFERESEVSLPLSANFLRVLDERGVAVGDLPLAAGVPKEAVSMALSFLVKTGYVVVETKVARLTTKGLEARKRSRPLHDEVERGWEQRFGDDALRGLRASLEGLAGQRLAEGLRPHPGGWRETKRYTEHTQAMLENPTAALPRYPMVLHRGGWPDGS